MGMDLIPINPTKDAPRYPADTKYYPNKFIRGRYNWASWSCLIQHLRQWGIDTNEFSRFNDGENK